jgi:hypothetical protein
VAPTSAPAALNLGFLTVLHEPSGYLGGYLVTNVWGRPLEFRLSTAVQPNRVQQILYGSTLGPYICGELIGKTLIEKTSVPVQIVVTDREAVLDLRQRVEFPVIWLANVGDEIEGNEVFPAKGNLGPVVVHPGFPQDVAGVRALLGKDGPPLDLSEPFARIREAISEARKTGVVSRTGAA